MEIRTYWHTYCRKRIPSYLLIQSLEPIVERKGEADKVIDLRGMSCPWSILKAKSELKRMDPGQVLEILGTDPLTLKDFPATLKETDDEVILVDESPGFFNLYVRKGN
jgi:tRNA 2-thiouridine synthesizing protein A